MLLQRPLSVPLNLVSASLWWDGLSASFWSFSLNRNNEGIKIVLCVLVDHKGTEMHAWWQILYNRLEHRLNKIFNTDPDYHNSDRIIGELLFKKNITKLELFAFT